MEDRTFRVYGLRCPTEKIIRYIGQTEATLEKRLKWHLGESPRNRGKNARKQRWIKKLASQNLKPEMVLIRDGLDSRQADALEIELIALFRYLVGKRLINISDGGKRTAQTLEVRQKMSRTRMGHEVSQETRNKIGAANKERWKSVPRKERSVQARTRILPMNKKPVGCFQGEQLVKAYSGAVDAVSDGFNRHKVTQCARGQRRTHRGFQWRYLDVPTRPFIEAWKDGKLVQSFASIKEAASVTGGSEANICDVARGRRDSCKGFVWKYAKGD